MCGLCGPAWHHLLGFLVCCTKLCHCSASLFIPQPLQEYLYPLQLGFITCDCPSALSSAGILQGALSREQTFKLASGKDAECLGAILDLLGICETC